MTDLQQLIHAVDELSNSELKQLYAHIVETHATALEEPKETVLPPRILGLFENVGETWMSDDFDAELPDSFWLGEGIV